MVYGGDVFSAHGFYFWIPVIGPYVGGALAGLLYKHTVEVSFMLRSVLCLRFYVEKSTSKAFIIYGPLEFTNFIFFII